MKIEANKFDETRPNIATDELSDAAQPLEDGLKHAVYNRNRVLDPQLVWRGKETHDESDLDVPIVPIYIQEEVRPRDIVESLRRDAQVASGANVSEAPGLFDTSDFLPLDKKIEICQHEEPWRNRMILGDSLLTQVATLF